MSEHFDLAAKAWDDVDYRHERARLAADEVLEQIDHPEQLSAMEFGCGTGLLSFSMNDNFKSITLIDSSIGMINEVNKKIEKQNINNCVSKCMILEKEEQLDVDFDVIYSMLTFHHVLEYQKLIKLFNNNLKENGKIFIVDLVEEDGSFHSNNKDFDGHNGFDPEKLSKTFFTAGFSKVHYKIFYTIKKEINGKQREYPLFILTGEK